jgi:hypothetical protein
MNLLSAPHIAVLQVPQNVYLFCPFRGIFFPTVPISVVIIVILPGTGLEDLIPGH